MSKFNNKVEEMKAQMNSAILKEFAKILDVKIVEIDSLTRPEHTGTIKLDGHVVTSIDIDHYNNFSAYIPNLIPREYIPKFRQVITGYLEFDGYKNRTGVVFFIKYFEQHHKNLSIKFVQWLCDIDDQDVEKHDDGFREWLVGSSYATHGNLENFRPDWDYDLFRKEVSQ